MCSSQFQAAALKVFPGVTMWAVTKKNRNALVKQVLEWMEAATSS
jgi:hypothetical protein